MGLVWTLVLLQFPEGLSTAKTVETQQFGFFLAPALSPPQTQELQLCRARAAPSPPQGKLGPASLYEKQNKAKPHKINQVKLLH